MAVVRKIRHMNEDGSIIEADIGTLAEHVKENESKRFVTDEEKEKWNGMASADGGDISDTVSDVAEPESASEKYPEIPASGGTSKTILGYLTRWVKSLKTDKADSSHNHDSTYVKISGGDAADTKVASFTASTASYPIPEAGDTMKVILGKLAKFCSDSKSHNHDNTYVKISGGDIAATKMGSVTASTASYPVPAAGDTGKVFMGKIIKFFNDIRNTATGACFIGQIVNNCTSTDTTKPLSAAQGKALMDLYNGLNTKKLPISKARDDNTSYAFQTRDYSDGNIDYHLNSGIYATHPDDPNNPETVYGMVIVFNTSFSTGSHAQAWIVQVLFPNSNSGKIYVRRNFNYTSTTWTDWKSIKAS